MAFGQGDLFGRAHGPPAAAMRGRHVESDAIQPCVKCAGTLERLQLEERLDEGLLDYVLGILGIAGHVDHGVVQPILVLLHQLPEG